MTTHRFVPTTYHNVIGSLSPALHVARRRHRHHRDARCRGIRQGGRPAGIRPQPDERPDLRRRRRAGRRAQGRNHAHDADPRHRLDPQRRGGQRRRSRERFGTCRRARTRPGTIDAAASTVRLAEPVSGLENFVLPLAPMIGCFGVAPGLGQAISTATSAENGGNMDYRVFGPGATVWFPVSAPGALFFLGDCHAMQGDGEIVGTGIETTFEVEVRLTVEKKAAIGLAARRDRGRHLHRRQCPAARPGAAARDHRNAQLAGVRLRPRHDRRQPSDGPGGALRRRQRLRPGLHDGLPHRQEVADQAIYFPSPIDARPARKSPLPGGGGSGLDSRCGAGGGAPHFVGIASGRSRWPTTKKVRCADILGNCDLCLAAMQFCRAGSPATCLRTKRICHRRGSVEIGDRPGVEIVNRCGDLQFPGTCKA